MESNSLTYPRYVVVRRDFNKYEIYESMFGGAVYDKLVATCENAFSAGRLKSALESYEP